MNSGKRPNKRKLPTAMKDSGMASVNIEKMSLKELLELEAKLSKAIPAARDRERSEAKQRLSELAGNYGFSVNELFGNGRGRGAKTAVKYRNPDNQSETWTGRGRKPNWMTAKLAKGGKMSDFEL